MNKVLRVLILLLISAGVSLALIYLLNIMQVERIRLRADSGKNPRNPSRGFYIQIPSHSPERLADCREEMSLCLLAYDLYDCRSRPIGEEKLLELEAFLEEAERQNMKCIFRAAYGVEKQECHDADSWELLTGHVKQIAPILNRHADEIYCVQAGFLGPWGEWHSSRYLSEENGPENRRQLTALLLETLDPELTIDLRRPRFIRELGASNARLGFHNDGLLASSSDLGTYDDPDYSRQHELQWLSDHVTVPQNGGEMPKVTEFTQAENALKEFSSMHLSYLNSLYNREVLDSWAQQTVQGQSALTYLSQRLGYRYYVSSLEVPEKLRSGIFSLGQGITLTLENEGFAPIDSRYSLEVILEDADGNISVCKSLPRLDPKQPELFIPASALNQADAKRVGLRISERKDSEKLPRNCAALVNEGISFQNGINYLLTIEDGIIYPE